MTTPDTPGYDCGCDWLENAANDPAVPITFDRESNEYVIERGGNLKGRLPIYYCPFCGGTAPRSKRDALFVPISAEEMMRLRDLTAGLETIADVLARLGPPDEDNSMGLSETIPRERDEPPRTRWMRTLRFNSVSPTAVVEAVAHPDAIRFIFFPKPRHGTR